MPITIRSPAIIDVEVEGIRFEVRPEKYDDFMAGMGLSLALASEADPKTVNFAAMCKSVMRRVVAWDGVVLPDGTHAPCTPENRDLLFGDNPLLLMELTVAVAARHREILKNSEASRDGSNGPTAPPAKLVESA